MIQTWANANINPAVMVNPLEVFGGPMESSYRLVKHFEETQPDVDYWFVVGVDVLSSLHEETDADKLL